MKALIGLLMSKKWAARLAQTALEEFQEWLSDNINKTRTDKESTH